ncbi:MAG: hypothetical protein SOW18_04250 [Peptoniphilus sp.]|nr:hypothetical protein [Peptoniphilus sp.]MDY3118732.1 hypothetical protein [Peptoniphilus sp.]
MNSLRKRLHRFSANHYGWDELNTLLFVASLLLRLTGRYEGKAYWSQGALVLLFLVIFRAFSGERGKRRKENATLLNALRPMKRSLRRVKDLRHYRYVHCPSCNKTARLPRGVGKVKITCPYCHFVYERRV